MQLKFQYDNLTIAVQLLLVFGLELFQKGAIKCKIFISVALVYDRKQTFINQHLNLLR